jgi:hypothetical protein
MGSTSYIHFLKMAPEVIIRLFPRIGEGCLIISVCLIGLSPGSSAQGLKGSPSQEELKSQRDNAIESFEKEKLERMKRNVGRWFIITKPDPAPEFFENPDALQKKFHVKEKDSFLVTEVVQNKGRDMNFYRVKMESGKILYLSADALYLELKIREGIISRLSKAPGSTRTP